MHKPEQRGHRNWPVLHSCAQFTDLEHPLIRHFHTLKTKAEIMPFHTNKRFANKFSKQHRAEQKSLNLWGAYREIIHKCLSNLAWSQKCLKYWHFCTWGFPKKTETTVKNPFGITLCQPPCYSCVLSKLPQPAVFQLLNMTKLTYRKSYL